MSSSSLRARKAASESFGAARGKAAADLQGQAMSHGRSSFDK